MSRLIVKGLPRYFTEENLRQHFGKQGDITDVKLIKAKTGESRRFAFIGYNCQESAENAVKFFNKSFIDTARIEVEIAKTFADPNVPISFREKRKKDTERLKRQEEELLKKMQVENKRVKRKSALEEEMENDPKFKEYMEVMKPSSQVKSWANDSIADGSGGPSSKELENALKGEESIDNDIDIDSGRTRTDKQKKMVVTGQVQPKVKSDEESDDEYNDFGHTKKGENEEEKEEEEEEMMVLDGSDNLARDEKVSDIEWLRSRKVRIKENGELPILEKEQDTKGKEETVEEESLQEVENEDNSNLILEKLQDTGRLFIRNISYNATEDDFRNLFQTYGPLEEVHIAIDTRTGKSKGFVYIQFVNSQDAVRAYEALDKQIFQGRLLHILASDKKKSHRLDEFDLKNLPLKKQRELKKKSSAAKSQFSWNSLYMNNDAVMESMAAKLGIKKSQLIDPENSSSAVKQALAEAHVIGDVRKFFKEKGVDLASFDKKERDDKIILIKNFTFGTSAEELGELFSQYGPVKRLLMPPAGTIAIVEFKDAPSARAAFTKLAYKRFNSSILYLEKGPKDLFTREPNSSFSDEIVNAGKEKQEEPVETITAKDVLGGDIEQEKGEDEFLQGPTVSIFVKNLNFSTTIQQLSDLFKPLPGFVMATVKTKPDPKRLGQVLSMGFGFAEFKSQEEASAAISTLDGYVLDGHKLQLKLSHKQANSKTASSSSSSSKSNKSSKIIIKNLPFEASRKDILELFGAFGQLKSVRVPKKFDQSARGFAFVEFNLLKEAENAMSQLEGVHLLGRRLVMQFAERDADNAEDEIERMTRKVKKQVGTQKMAEARLAGKSKIDLEEKDQDEDGL
ncbi:MRD1 [Candida oxycetoniae]|uniref:Multiple RNA-binding domain-containing protein 1 n=1 Tax=Candida oxycetoniae TaxID=497107 RepID=A0AAI9SU20_9ASCO|nr:MRD1 [Candida oxycetoniae]KAI3402895.2 MRD1 [Candida oxycetoniae]